MTRLRCLLFLRVLALPFFVYGSGSVGICGAEETIGRVAREVIEGQSVTMIADVSGGSSPFTYQWNKDDVPIPGALDRVLVFAAIQLSDAGSYAVSVSNGGGTAFSPTEILIVKPAVRSRLANVSIVTSGEGVNIVGFMLSGSDANVPTGVLVRAAGPSLSKFGMVGVLGDPILDVFQGTRLIGSNDDWTGEEVRSAAIAVGAFPFPIASKDSALILSLLPASYSAQVMGASGANGIAVVELYDLNSGSARSISRLVNISARGVAGGNGKTIIAGFTIQGDLSMNVLLRGIGPTLALRFGVSGALGDPRLTLFRDSSALSSNENWREGDSDEIARAASAVGAFMLPDDSVDSAMLATLPPGAYTVQLSSVSGADGIGLIEIYEVSQAIR